MNIIFCKKTEHLADKICSQLHLEKINIEYNKFISEEISISILQKTNSVIIIAATEKNEDWIELLLILNSLEKTKKIILFFSYFGYARQSSAVKMWEKLLLQMNVSKCFLLEAHSNFFGKNIPANYIKSTSILINDIKKHHLNSNLIIISPDIGASSKVIEIAKILGVEYIICEKFRDCFGNVKNIYFSGDVYEKTCVIVDDIVDSGDTLILTAQKLKNSGAEKIISYSIHGLFSKNSIEKLNSSAISKIIYSNSLPNIQKKPEKFRKLSIDSLIVDAIRGIV